MDTYIDIDIDIDIHAICSNMSGPGVGSKIPIKFRRSSVHGSLPSTHVLSHFSCVLLLAAPGILQARILKGDL